MSVTISPADRARQLAEGRAIRAKQEIEGLAYRAEGRIETAYDPFVRFDRSIPKCHRE